MLFCKNCGHADYAHFFYVGRCIHGEMKPKDGLDCNCPGMDSTVIAMITFPRFDGNFSRGLGNPAIAIFRRT